MPELHPPPAPGLAPAAPPLTPEPPRRAGLPLWFTGLAPLVLLAALVLAFLRFGPVGVFRAAFRRWRSSPSSASGCRSPASWRSAS